MIPDVAFFIEDFFNFIILGVLGETPMILKEVCFFGVSAIISACELTA